MNFKNILVPYDNSANSKRALKQALVLAGLSDGKITIVHSISYDKAMGKIIEPYKETLLQHIKKFMNEIERDASRLDIPINEEILYGSPAEKILDLMKKKSFDIVIIGRRGTNKITGPSLGSVSNAIVQNSQVPVLVIM
jgi:nucleotide-binding universal stress UspA family protein